MVIHGFIPQSSRSTRVAIVGVTRILIESSTTGVSILVVTLEVTGDYPRRFIKTSPQVWFLWPSSPSSMGTYHTPLVR